jgi:pilus assembly protein CpaC
VAAVLYAEDPKAPADKGKAEPEAPQFLPAYTPPRTPATGASSSKESLPPGVSPNSVLLPPIQSLPSENKNTVPRPMPIGKPAESRLSEGSHLPSLLDPPPVVGAPKPPAPKVHKPAPAASDHAVLPTESTLEVVIGQPRLLVLPDVPERIALTVDERDPVASLQAVPHRTREWYILGKKAGTAFLDVRLPDSGGESPQGVLHYLVRVRRDPENKQVLDGVYQALEREISRSFPGCVVHFSRADDKLIVSGHARNIFEATRILKVAREHAPGARAGQSGAGERGTAESPSLQALLDNYATAGGPRVINLLRIPGEQQIMLRVVVAEVNRAAARSLGLDLSIGDKQATILKNRSTAGSRTVVDNGWIGQAIRTLQDQHYAQSLAEPTLTTLNGQAARFKAGGEFPVPVVSPSPNGAVQGVAFRSYGVALTMQPVVSDSERIRLTVSADVSGTDPAAGAQVAGTSVPGLKVRNFQSTVELREGETLAVAGLIRNPGAPPAEGRAGFGDLPSGDELVVLISPLLLRPGGSAEATASPLSAQNVELYLRSRGTFLPRADSLFLIGPQGYAEEARRGTALPR